MNKKILTVAVASALVAPMAAFSDVTVYGQLHTSLDYISSKSEPASYSGTVNGVPYTVHERKSNLNVSSNSSRLGFKGTEDLGGGLKTIWQLESEVNLTDSTGAANTGPTSLAGRNSFLGLSGGFGTFLTGRHDTPYKMLGRSLDPFGDTVGDTRQLLGIGFDSRRDNVIAYITPNFSGFSAIVAYVDALNYTTAGANSGNVGQDNSKVNAWSLNATYSNGPIYVGGAYERHNIKTLQTSATSIYGDTQSAYRLGGSYAIGTAKVGAMWESLNYGNVPGSLLTSSTEQKQSGWTLFGTYGFGSEEAKIAYTQLGKAKVGGTETPDSSASLLAVGLDHNFSKRTKGYVQYTRLANDDKSNYEGINRYWLLAMRCCLRCRELHDS